MSQFQSQRMVSITGDLYYKLGRDVPVFPPLRSASQSVSQLASCNQPVYAWLPHGNVAYSTPQFLGLNVCSRCCNFPPSLALPASTNSGSSGFAGLTYRSFLLLFTTFCLHDSGLSFIVYISRTQKHFTLLTSAFRLAHLTPSVETRVLWKCSSFSPTITFLPSDAIFADRCCAAVAHYWMQTQFRRNRHELQHGHT